MENGLDKLLLDALSAETNHMEAPDYSLLVDARNKVRQRKNVHYQREDIFSLLASFLNMKIKLYHAVIICLVVGAFIFYFSKEDKDVRQEAGSVRYESNIAAVRNSTVLSCIHTFGVRK